MAIKIDLEKAYDKISWSFLHSVLLEVNLPQSWIKLIMTCITGTHASLLWNGEQTDSLKLGRGLRQVFYCIPTYLFFALKSYLRWFNRQFWTGIGNLCGQLALLLLPRISFWWSCSLCWSLCRRACLNEFCFAAYLVKVLASPSLSFLSRRIVLDSWLERLVLYVVFP